MSQALFLSSGEDEGYMFLPVVSKPRLVGLYPPSRMPPFSPFGSEKMSHHHPAIIKRLKRADGHLRTIIEMIEKGRPCHQLAQQLQAVESAIENAKKVLDSRSYRSLP
jgi:hypothetical protein